MVVRFEKRMTRGGGALFLILSITVAPSGASADADDHTFSDQQVANYGAAHHEMTSAPKTAALRLRALGQQGFLLADYALYDLGSLLIERGEVEEGIAALDTLQRMRSASAVLQREAMALIIRTACADPATSLCGKRVWNIGHKRLPASFLPELEFFKGERYRMIGKYVKGYKKYQTVYYDYPASPLAEKARVITIALRREKKGRRYPAATYRQRLGRVNRLMKGYRYALALNGLNRMRKIGYDRGRREVIDHKRAWALYRGRKRSEAKEAYIHFLADYPRSKKRYEAEYRIARIDWNADRDAEAAERLKRLDESGAPRSLKGRVRYVLGRIAESRGDRAAASRWYEKGLALHPDREMTQRLGWAIAWNDYQRGEYRLAAERFLKTAPTANEKGVGRHLYWGAVARRKGGDEAGAQKLMARLRSTYPHTYYGQLVMERRNGDSSLNLAGVSPELRGVAAELTTTRKMSKKGRWRYDRYRALMIAGLPHRARRELDGLVAVMRATPSNLLWLGVLYTQAGASGKAIHLQNLHFSSRERKDDFDHPFWRVWYPVSHGERVREASRAAKIDPALPLAIIRQESAFDPEAHSAANAYGLMQLIVPTAEKIYTEEGFAQRRGAPLDEDELFDPDLNISLGVAYFARLLKRYHRNSDRALAAYNAGEAAVDTWIARFGQKSPDEFIEMIPYAETRNYVKRVRRNRALYHRIYGATMRTSRAPK